FIQFYADVSSCQQQVNCASGLVRTDFTRPWNPGDILHFGADTNAWHNDHHVMTRLGEFLLYDEYDPRRTILLNDDGSVAKTGPAYTSFINNDPTDGRNVTGCSHTDNSGKNCLATSTVQSDGNDNIFGDLGNDWILGGTGQDQMYGGWGNDLLNADDVMT